MRLFACRALVVLALIPFGGCGGASQETGTVATETPEELAEMEAESKSMQLEEAAAAKSREER